MSQSSLFQREDYETLQRARDTYGAHKQIGVAAEECTELAKELIKAFRYDNFEDAVKKTKENVVDEVADILIVMDHILTLYDIKKVELRPQIQKKLNRLKYWLDHSDNIEFTTQYRTLEVEEPEEEADEGALFAYYLNKYYQEQAEEERARELAELKPTHELGGVRLYDRNDEKYRKDNE